MLSFYFVNDKRFLLLKDAKRGVIPLSYPSIYQLQMAWHLLFVQNA